MSDPVAPKLKEMIATINGWLHSSPDSGRLWDILTCLRGPDSPSERPDMTPAQQDQAYKARRNRKYNTVEVIRGKTFPNCGGARWHTDTKVTLPPKTKWDHFDRHVNKAAQALGLQVVIETEPGALKVDPKIAKEEKIPAPKVTLSYDPAKATAAAADAVVGPEVASPTPPTSASTLKQVFITGQIRPLSELKAPGAKVFPGILYASAGEAMGSPWVCHVWSPTKGLILVTPDAVMTLKDYNIGVDWFSPPSLALGPQPKVPLVVRIQTLPSQGSSTEYPDGTVIFRMVDGCFFRKIAGAWVALNTPTKPKTPKLSWGAVTAAQAPKVKKEHFDVLDNF